MPHIHAEPGQHDHTASAFIIDVSEAEPRLWLHEHKRLGRLMQFGGHVELDENPWQAVCHEIREESGFTMDQLKVLQPDYPRPRDIDMVVWPQPFMGNTHEISKDHFHDDLNYAFVTTEAPKEKVGEGESTRFHLFSQAEVAALGPQEIATNTQEMSRFLYEVILDRWVPIECSEFQS